jgi:hypothetical protein
MGIINPDGLDFHTANDLVLTYHGLCLSIWLRTLRSKLAAKKAEIDKEEDFVRNLEREVEALNKELQSRKYHDIGHARAQFENKVVDGHRVALTPEELDPVVRGYLERRKLYEPINVDEEMKKQPKDRTPGTFDELLNQALKHGGI